MNKEQKILVTLLLIPGHYLRFREKTGGRKGYVLYRNIQDPIRWFKKMHVDFLFSDELLKIDKKDRLSLHRGNIRRLHGNSILKKLYKKKNGLTAPEIGLRFRKKSYASGIDQPVLF